MKGNFLCMFWLIPAIFIAGCHFRKGESYTWTGTADTVPYFIAASGSGRHILNKVSRLTSLHEKKEDDCRVIYVSDSSSLAANRSILLFNSVLPDMKDDMLSKGFMGTFGTREVITYLIVTKKDFDKYLTPVKK